MRESAEATCAALLKPEESLALATVSRKIKASGA
jgi:hypothetical protein